MKEIIFKIDAEGEISMEVQGVVGQSCDELTAPFEELLGSVANKTRKSEFYAEEKLQDYVEESHE